MINLIDEIREAIERAFDPARMIPDEHFSDISPCGRYRIDVDSYSTLNCAIGGWISVATVRASATGDVIATVKRNDDRWFHGWIIGNDGDYLVCSEDLEGQTVVDLRSGSVVGFSSKSDPFIWCQFHPSGDKKRLAIIGCYWACPYLVVVYDFGTPMSLPLRKIAEYVLKSNDTRFGEWLDKDRFTLLESDGTVTVQDVSRMGDV
jgi:hypothetical protein